MYSLVINQKLKLIKLKRRNSLFPQYEIFFHKLFYCTCPTFAIVLLSPPKLSHFQFVRLV